MERSSKAALAILGGGGHACVLIEALRSAYSKLEAIILDADPALHGTEILGVRVLGDDALLPKLLEQGVQKFTIGVGSSSNTTLREKLFKNACGAGLQPMIVRHSTAVVAPSASIGPGSQLLAGSIINSRAVIGCNSIVNTGAIIEHDCRIGEHVHIASGALLCGGVVVGDGCHIGARASIKQGITIGAAAIVGLGAAVVKDVPPGTTVVGVPAQQMRRSS